MNAEIITIGDEILIGQIVDSNSAFIAQELNKIGISVVQISSIQDETKFILNALQEAAQRADIILITGGLGPTKDDVTKYSFCDFFQDQLVRNDVVLKHIEQLFLQKYANSVLSELNKEQAMVPSKAEVLFNEFGTAPGLWMERDNKVFIAMPGVPYEMKAILEKQVIPKLQKKFKRPFIYHKTILIKGLGESAIADKLANWEEQLPKFLKFAYLPDLGTVRVRLSGKAENEKELKLAVEEEFEKLYKILGDYIPDESEEDDKIVVEISKILTSRKQFLATAESFTGGSIAAEFTTRPGASACFKGGIVSYATQSKQDVLKVPKEIIEKHSVVSAEVAEKMAINAKNLFKTDFALATTGNAGPTKGDSEAEVGTVFIALACPDKVISKKYMLGNNRHQVVKQAINKAFEMILNQITAKSEI